LEQLKKGTLVYADLEGTNAHPTVRAIYPVAISRAMYERTIRDVIAKHHEHLLPSTNINELCLASRVFGWVSQEGDEDLTKEVAYRGRVRFSNATVTHAIKNDAPLTLSILGAPHPTSLEFYLDDIQHIKAQRDGQHGYNETNAKIRGRKIYRHHGQFNEDEAKIHDIHSNSDQNRSIIGAHDEGTVYSFTIEFENMQPVELGALLWTLELGEGNTQGYHRIGYGKPLGFGSVQIEVTSLDFYDAKTRYAADKRVEFTDDEKKKQQQENVRRYKPKLVNRFQTAISRLYGNTPFDKLDNIVDLLALLSECSDALPIHYPRLDPSRQAADNEGFRWFMTNRDGQQERLKPAQTDDGLPYDVSADNRRNRR
jgi:CRISPR-associated protein (TIGR03986 family)